MNYSEMTDFEINIEVAKATGHKPLDESNGWKGLQERPFTAVICRGPRKLGGFDPCNSWSDAGPIIQQNNISLLKCEQMESWVAGNSYWVDGAEWSVDWLSGDKKPLRAAMIAYLMMQEKSDA